MTKPTLGYDITLSAPQVLGDGKGERLELPLKIEKGDAQSLARPDIYVEHKANRQLQRFVHPLWVGTVLMLLGGMVAIIRRRQR